METSLGVRRGMPWIKPFVRALTIDESRERGRAEGTMPIGDKASCRQRLKREEGRQTGQGSDNRKRWGDGRERDRQMPKVGLCRLKTTEEGY